MARVKEEVGWAVTEGVAAGVGRVREMTEAAEVGWEVVVRSVPR